MLDHKMNVRHSNLLDADVAFLERPSDGGSDVWCSPRLSAGGHRIFTLSKFGISKMLKTRFHVVSVDTQRRTQASMHGAGVVIADMSYCYESQEDGREGASQAR